MYHSFLSTKLATLLHKLLFSETYLLYSFISGREINFSFLSSSSSLSFFFFPETNPLSHIIWYSLLFTNIKRMAICLISCRWTRAKTWYWQLGTHCLLGSKQRCAKDLVCCSIEKNDIYYNCIKNKLWTKCWPWWVLGPSFICLLIIPSEPLPISSIAVNTLPVYLYVPLPFVSMSSLQFHLLIPAPSYITRIMQCLQKGGTWTKSVSHFHHAIGSWHWRTETFAFCFLDVRDCYKNIT